MRASSNCQSASCSSCARNHSLAARTASRAARSAKSWAAVACCELRRGVKAMGKTFILQRQWPRERLRLFCAHRLAAFENFALGERAVRGFRPFVNALYELIGNGNAVLLQPEVDVGLAAHRTDLDDLLQPEEVAGYAGINRVGQLHVILLVGLDDRGSVHA